MDFPCSLRLAATALVIGVCGLAPLPAPPAAASSATTPSWQWPLDPQPPLVRGFDPPEAPWLPGHRGIDLAAVPGQPVLAVAPGTVTYAGEVAGVGVVVVDHGAVRSTYQPVVARAEAGEWVQAGTALGVVTTVGSHCLPASCLHLGARSGADYLDPLRLLGPLRVRLKPMTPPPRAPPGPGLVRPARTTSALPAVDLGAWVSLAIGRP
jgi:murein DD-endopeptidase MepM/ murein hydrolase activator NlpD